jgi:hypothetical protein
MANYHKIIRKMVVGFGDLFNDIDLIRYNPDGTEAQRQKVPLAYAPKERYVMRLQGDPDLDKKVQITLPRMSFEMTGLRYDSSRKGITNIKNYAPSANPNTILTQYNPVPYDFDFSLYIYVRNIEDGTQIIERILPFFTPDYTIRLNLIPEMGIIKEVPITLKDTSYDIDYEGGRDNPTRTIIWTLTFTVKGFVFGPTSEPKIIRKSITQIFDNTLSDSDAIDFTVVSGGLGDYQEGEIVYQGLSLNDATASAKCLTWSSSSLKMKVSDIYGNFVSSQPLRGATTGAVYVIQAFKFQPELMVKIEVEPNPNTATANSDYTYNTTITEFPL